MAIPDQLNEGILSVAGDLLDNQRTPLSDLRSILVRDATKVDPSFDIAGVRTQTSTRPELLAAVPEFSGFEFDPTKRSYIEDLYTLYGGGVPTRDIAMGDTAQIPGVMDTLVNVGGGGGGMDQVTSGLDTTPQDFGQSLVDQGIGVQATPTDPVVAPGEMPLTQDDFDDFNKIAVTPQTFADTGRADLLDQAGNISGVGFATDFFPDINTVTSNPRAPGQDLVKNLDEVQLGPVQPGAGKISLPGGQTINQVDQVDQGMPPQLGDRGASMDYMSGALNAPFGVNPETGIPYQQPRTIADQNRVLGIVTEEDAANPKGLLERIGLGNLNPAKAAVAAAINKAVGAPVSLLVTALEALPQYEPTFEERTLEGELGVTADGKFAGSPSTSAFAGLNAVSGFGDPVKTAKNRIDTRLETIENNPNVSEKFKKDTQTMIEEYDRVTNKLGDIDAIPAGDAQVAEETIGTPLEITEARQEQGQQIQEIQQQEVVQSGSKEADRQQRDTGAAKVGASRYETKSGDVYASAAEAAEKGDGGGSGGGGKIVCTMMNESYGFGSFRNKIWLKHSKDLAPEYQIGYHKIFLPLVRLSKKNIVLKKILEHIAVHRTIDIRQESRGKVHLLGRVYRKILEPICYWVGKHD